MPILCATDLSDGGTAAARAAAALSARLSEPLVLLHVVDVASEGMLEENTLWSIRERAEHLLQEEAARLRKTGISAAIRIETGRAHEVILRTAAELRPSLLVVAAARGALDQVPAGSTVQKLARSVTGPLLVVRDESQFEAWAAGGAPLRAVLGADSTRATRAAAAWLSRLRHAGAVDTTVVHAWNPDDARDRLGMRPWTNSGAPNPELEALLARQAAAAVGPLPGQGSLRVRAVPGNDAVGPSLVRAGREESASVLVLGTSQRMGIARLRHGSVAADVLEVARVAVCVVPAPPAAAPEARIYRSVLAVTDLSPLGNAAIPHAYALLPAGGTVHLLHVRETPEPGQTSMILNFPTSAPDHAAQAAACASAAADLAGLVPEDADPRGIETRIEVAEAAEAASGICQAARRLAVDAIVLGTRGRSGIGKAVLGSVSDRVLKEAGLPVLLVGPLQP